MTIRAKAQVVTPDDVIVEITFTATIGELRALMRQQKDEWPSYDLGRVLADVIGKTVGRIEHSHDVV